VQVSRGAGRATAENGDMLGGIWTMASYLLRAPDNACFEDRHGLRAVWYERDPARADCARLKATTSRPGTPGDAVVSDATSDDIANSFRQQSHERLTEAFGRDRGRLESLAPQCARYLESKAGVLTADDIRPGFSILAGV